MRPSRSGRAESAPQLSVVIPTRDRHRLVERALAALAAQEDAPPFEVVVVDDGSTDGTVAALHGMAATLPYRLTVVASAAPTGPAGARNRGWRAAVADAVLFTDDDCVPGPHWVRHMADGLAEADIVVGRTRPPPDQLGHIGPFSSYLDMDHDGRFSTCNVGYRRAVLRALDGFDAEHFRYPNGEDTDLGLRALGRGYRDTFAEGGLVWHDVHPSEFRSHLRRVKRLDGLVVLVARHPQARSLLNAGWFLRSVDKAVLMAWATLLVAANRPGRRSSWAAVAAGAALYTWQFDRSHYPARSIGERLISVPQGFVADSLAVAVMARSSLRWRTLLL